MRTFLLLAALAALLPGHDARASGWPTGKRKVLLVPGFYYYRASRYWNQAGQSAPFGNDGRFTSPSFRLYGEYGFSERLNAVATLPVAFNRYQATNLDLKNSGFGDAEVGLRYTLFRDSLRTRFLSAQVVGILPLYQNSQQPYLGYATAGVEARLLFSGSVKLGARYGYFNVESGYRLFGALPGGTRVRQVPLLGTFGYYLSGSDVLAGEVAGLISFSNQFRELNPTNPGINTDFRFFKTTLTYGRRVSGSTWLYAGLFADVSGRNVGIGRGGTLYAVVKF